MTRKDAMENLVRIYQNAKIAICMDCGVLLPHDEDAEVECPSCIQDMEVFENASHLLDHLEDQGYEITHMILDNEVERMLIVNVERYTTFSERRQLLAACGW